MAMVERTRRAFLMLLGGVAAPPLLWPLASSGQPPTRPVIGFLSVASTGSASPKS